MSDKCFIDTNILVYTLDQNDPIKCSRSRALISESHWQVSWQVVQEFANVALYRFATPMQEADLEEYLKLLVWPKCAIYPSAAIFNTARLVREKTGYRFYDSLIVASALASGVSILYSEDLQHGRKIGPLTILNPFLVPE